MSDESVVSADLLAQVAAAADQIDAERQLPGPVVQSLSSAGLFRSLIPVSLQGLQLPLVEFLNLVERLAVADASTSWCVTQGAVIGVTSVWLEPEIAAELWHDPATAFANGPPLDCTATRVDGGYELSGRWGFSSGCQHASMMVATAPVVGSRRWVMGVFPKDRATFHDNWQVPGLRGTGSFEFSLNGLFIEERWAVDMSRPPMHQGDLYKIPLGLLFAVSFASVALGVARAGLDVVFALAADKVPGYTRQVLRDDTLVQDQLGRAEVRWRAARAYLHATVAEVASTLAPIEAARDEERIALRMAGTHVIREAAAVLDIAYQVAGSSGIYQSNPLQRRVQDMNVITQHVQGRRSHYAFVGKYLLGFPFQPGPLN